MSRKNKQQHWFDIKAKSDEEVEIFIYGDIGETWFGDGISAKDFNQQLSGLKNVKKITARLNSPGGSVPEGIAIYNALLNHPAEIEIMIDGWAASIASIIALAGDTVKIADNAFMMIHDPWGVIAGTAQEMRDYADFLDKNKDILVSTYEKHSTMSRDDIETKMSDETWFNAQEALDAGLVDEIISGSKAAAHVNAKRFRNIPEKLLASICNCPEKPEAESKKPAPDPVEEPPVTDPPEGNTPANNWRSIVAERIAAIVG